MNKGYNMEKGLEVKLGRTLDHRENDEQVSKIFNKIVGEMTTDVINGSVVGKQTVTYIIEDFNPGYTNNTEQAVQLAKDYFDNEKFPTTSEPFSVQYEHGDVVKGFILEITLWSGNPDFQI
jgi:hypothetical protein